jgi:hypothetical protein
VPGGHFSRSAYIGRMATMVLEAFAQGYGRFRAIGDESFIVRNSADINEWFAAGAELNKIVPGWVRVPVVDTHGN